MVKEEKQVKLVVIAPAKVKESAIVQEWLKLTEKILNSELDRITTELRAVGYASYPQLPISGKG